MDERQAWDLIQKILAEGESIDEHPELTQYLRQNPEIGKEYESLRRFLTVLGENSGASRIQPRISPKELAYSIRSAPSKGMRWSFPRPVALSGWAVAVVVLAFILVKGDIEISRNRLVPADIPMLFARGTLDFICQNTYGCLRYQSCRCEIVKLLFG